MFSLSGISSAKLKKEELASLHKHPKKDKIRPHIQVHTENAVH